MLFGASFVVLFIFPGRPMKKLRWPLLIAVLALVVIGALLLSQRPTALQPIAEPEVEPAEGGVYAEGLVGSLIRLNPLLDTYNSADRDLDRLLYSGLLRFDDRGIPQGDLSNSWGISRDGTIYNFSLRDTAVWHDGEPVTSDDVIFTIETMRAEEINTPVLILSARQSVDDRIQGLQRGGDDYMVKPFSFSELLARVQALIRRDKKNTKPMFLTVGQLEMDLLKHEVVREGEKIELPAKEYALLEYMMHNPGIVLSKTSILERVYDYAFDPQTNVVDVLVCRLRNKVDKDFQDKMIHTVRGVGYVLKAD